MKPEQRIEILGLLSFPRDFDVVRRLSILLLGSEQTSTLLNDIMSCKNLRQVMIEN